MRMDAATRLRYLEAMGIDVWQLRQTDAVVEAAPVVDKLDAALEQAIEAPAPKVPKLDSMPPPQVAEPAPSALVQNEDLSRFIL